VTELKTEGNKLILLVVIVRGSMISMVKYYPKELVCIHKLIEPYQIDS
jgi:hypothetical protein